MSGVLNLNLDDGAIQQALSVAILNLLTEQSKQEVIAKAIASLAAPQDGGYGRQRPSQLQEAFDRAIWTVAQEEVNAYVKASPEFRERIRGLIASSAEKVLASNADMRAVIVESVTSAIIHDYEFVKNN